MSGAMPTPEPQAILLPPSQAAIFLVLVVEPGHEAGIRDFLAEVNGLRRSVGFRIPEARLSCVTGISAALWDRLFDPPRPAELHVLPEIAGDRHVSVSTPGDLLFHIRASRLDLCFELAQRLTEALEGHGRVIDEVHGFRSFDERDLLGFVDGTENPEGGAAQTAALITDEDPAFAGPRRRGAGERHRPHQALQPRTARRRQAAQLPRGADDDRGRGR
jgi:porphyrinogen peroxidase